MPRYHFDLIGRNTIADRTGLLLPDDIHASDAADRLASELYEIRPELRVRECAVLVTDDDGEEVHRVSVISRYADLASTEFWLAVLRDQGSFQSPSSPSMDGDEEERCVIVVDENGAEIHKAL
jgi:hypothetical protein